MFGKIVLGDKFMKVLQVIYDYFDKTGGVIKKEVMIGALQGVLVAKSALVRVRTKQIMSSYTRHPVDVPIDYADRDV